MTKAQVAGGCVCVEVHSVYRSYLHQEKVPSYHMSKPRSMALFNLFNPCETLERRGSGTSFRLLLSVPFALCRTKRSRLLNNPHFIIAACRIDTCPSLQLRDAATSTSRCCDDYWPLPLREYATLSKGARIVYSASTTRCFLRFRQVVSIQRLRLREKTKQGL